MGQILEFVAAYMGYLWPEARFRITDSDVTKHNGNNSMLTIESDLLRLRLETDRRQLLLDFQPVHTDRPKDWYSVGIVRRFFRGTSEPSGLLDESFAAFVGEYLDDIEDHFSPARWEETRTALKELERKRSKEMWG
ncbi:hypothetical protein [Promicromonospora sukumoe]